MLSRRTFLASAAAAPLLVTKPVHVVVVGAGAFGGWTALQLVRRGARVTLLDAWGAGNTRSSSGGETRVIRAIYGPDRIYSERVKRSYEMWDELQRTTGQSLYVETGALWLHRGDDAYVRSSEPILRELGFPLQKLSLSDARQRYPQISFDSVKSAWLEGRAGALSARRACEVIVETAHSAGATYHVASAQPGPIERRAMRSVRIIDRTIEADAFVFACGPWLARVFPNVIGHGIQPTRQEVHYFGLPAGSRRYQPGALPIWIDFGDRIFYGIPDVHGRGLKIADDTRGEPIDPTTAERKPSEEGIARARRLIAERFPDLAKAPLISAEVCQYENSPDGHLVLDRHPDADNVWIAGGGSGHGFKLGPAVGSLIADAVLEGKPLPAMFNVARLREAKKPSTQFDAKRS